MIEERYGRKVILQDGGYYLYTFAENGYDVIAGIERLCSEFKVHESIVLAGYQVLLATYTNYDYTGDAYVLMRKKDDRTLWEINASHCSCHGLENQFDLEFTTIESIKHRVSKGNLGSGDYSGYFQDVLLHIIKQSEKKTIQPKRQVYKLHKLGELDRFETTSMVVFALDETDARFMAASLMPDEKGIDWLDPKFVSCELIDNSIDESRVILIARKG